MHICTIGAFGRFFLVSVLTGGRFKTVHLCAATQILHNKGKTLLSGLRIYFTVDIANQPKSELFVNSAKTVGQSLQGELMCARELLYVPLIPYRKMYHWFTDRENMTHLRDSYSGMCGIEYKEEAIGSEEFKPRVIKSKNTNILQRSTTGQGPSAPSYNDGVRRRMQENNTINSADTEALSMAFSAASSREQERYESRIRLSVSTSTRQKTPEGMQDDVAQVVQTCSSYQSDYNIFKKTDLTTLTHVTYSRYYQAHILLNFLMFYSWMTLLFRCLHQS